MLENEMKIGICFSALLAVSAHLGTVETVQAQGPGGLPGGLPGRPSFDRILKAFDANNDGALEESELPPRVWIHRSKADANGDGVITEKEFGSFRPRSR